MRTLLLILTITAMTTPAWASSPGERLACSDWVFLEPGLYCEESVPYPCEDSEGDTRLLCLSGGKKHYDNDGRLLRVRTRCFGDIDRCPLATGIGLCRTELLAYDGQAEAIIAYLPERCVADEPTGGGMTDKAGVQGATNKGVDNEGNFAFDSVGGKVFIPLDLYCFCFLCNRIPAECAYEGGDVGMTIGGLTTLFEVLQTYTPDSVVGFRVPYMPEGMGGADYFDTFYGSLARPLDLAQAQPLRCGYPETGPGPETGDYLTVADTVPTPAPGHTIYYLTAATYLGETRAGRKADRTGRLSGRDSNVLPECVDPAQ